MKFESEIIKEILDSRGHEKTSIHYQSECVKEWVKEVEGAYPKLCDYQSEWLNYNLENNVGFFPYITLTDVTEATIENVVPYAYKSASLKGCTGYRDIDTGEILETFEEGRNLELVSVKMPVLTTTGKNLFDGKLENGAIISSTGVSIPSADNVRSVGYIKVNPNASIVLSNDLNYSNNIIYEYDSNEDYIGRKTTNPFTTSTNCHYIRFRSDSNQPNLDVKYQIEYGTIATPYEPFKSNILTVNEDVELGSVGEVKDELNLLTGQLTQRTETRAYQEGDESNSEVITDMANTRYKLPKESIKTVDLLVVDQDGKSLERIKPIEGTMHLNTSGETIKPLFSGEIPVEAITQNIASFIEE